MRRSDLTYAALFLLLIVLLSGCDQANTSRTQVWIDVPLSGVEVEVDTIRVQSHAASRNGITHVELWVNGVLYRSDDNPTPDEPVINVIQPWIPATPGEYALQVRAYAPDGSNGADDVLVTVSGEVATSVPETPTAEFLTPTPVPPTPTGSPVPPTATSIPLAPTSTPIPPTAPPPPTAEPQISFWADATDLKAGNCTTVHWETENVQAVFFDGQGVPGAGTHQTCPCSSETHTLEVHLPDGSKDTRTLNIDVVGSCVTPTPEGDTDPPPAPTLLSPEDGWAADCSRTHVSLSWQAVSDPSGVAGYEIEVEWYTTTYWLSYRFLESTYESAILESDPPGLLPCADFRWRVRAIDGEENEGPWSDWFYFELDLI